MRILTNLNSLQTYPLPADWQAQFLPRGQYPSLRQLSHMLNRVDVVLIDDDLPLLWRLCSLAALWPNRRWKLISLDIVLVKPTSLFAQVNALPKRWLLRQVDHFIHYFKDLSGYARYFGVDASRSSYVPFKVNGWEEDRLEMRASCANPSGDYVLTCGRSLRDLPTFCSALERTGLPAKIVVSNLEQLRRNGSSLPTNLPSNIELIDDLGSRERYYELIEAARLVVVPILPSNIRAVGVSTCLEAMGRGKCVIVSSGSNTHQMLDAGQAILVKPADSAGLASAVANAWHHEILRQSTAKAGLLYARSLAGRDRLCDDVLAICLKQANPSREISRIQPAKVA